MLAHSPGWHAEVVFELRIRWAPNIGIEGRRPLTPEHENKCKDAKVREMREGQQ
jgi:hypothetical protein